MIALGCGLTNWGDCLREFLEFAVKTVLGGMVDLIMDAIQWVVAQAVKFILESVGTLWIRIPTVPITEGPNFTKTSELTFVHGQLQWFVFAAGVVSVIIAGIRMAYHQRGEPLRDLFKSLLTLAMVSATGLALITLLTQIADALAENLINASLGSSGDTFARRMSEFIVTPMTAPNASFAMVVVFGVVAIITSFIQIVFMIVRSAMLILMAGVLPIAAAATNTEMGKAWFRKVVGWTAAFIAYKPLAALVYAAALSLAGNPEGDLIKVATGVTMMALAVVALPALIRLVAPKGAGG
jgi:hypothetical protein